MSHNHYKTQSGSFFKCNEHKELVIEYLIPEHLLLHVYSGKIHIITTEASYLLSGGQSVLLARNQLVKIKKEPGNGADCICATLFFTKPFLQRFYQDAPTQEYKMKKHLLLQFDRYPLLDNLFSSISLFANLNEKGVPKI